MKQEVLNQPAHSAVESGAMSRSSAGSYSGRYGVPGQVVCPRIFCCKHSATFLRVSSLMLIDGRRQVGPESRDWIDG